MPTLPDAIRPTWAFLAELTTWFDWEALSAIGTVGALWFAVIQSSRSVRADRMRALGIQMYLISLLGPVELVGIYETSDDDELQTASADSIALDLKAVRQALKGIEQLPLLDASFVDAVEWVMALPIALREIEEALVHRSLLSETTAQSSIAYVSEAVSHFRKSHDRLKHGLIGQRIRKWWYRRGYGG